MHIPDRPTSVSVLLVLALLLAGGAPSAKRAAKPASPNPSSATLSPLHFAELHNRRAFVLFTIMALLEKNICRNRWGQDALLLIMTMMVFWIYTSAEG